MICDRCGRDNPEQLIFCQDCGQRLQDHRVVPPTPPEGIPSPGGAPARNLEEVRQPQPSPSTEPQDTQEASDLVCQRCQTRNPSVGKFCVSCGATLRAPVQEPARDPEPMEPAGAVHLLQEAKPEEAARIKCERCQGLSEGGMRFCKFCGAPLATEVENLKSTLDHGGHKVPAGVEPTTQASAQPQDPVQNGLQDALRAAALEAAADQPPGPVPAAPLEPTTRRAEGAQIPAGARSPEEMAQATSTPAAQTGQFVPFAGTASLPSGRLVIVGADGQEGPSFPLTGDQLDIGRVEGSVVLSDDRYMSPRHARLLRSDGQWRVRDLESTNGVFVRLANAHDLVNGDLLLLGVEVLRFEIVMEAESGLGPAVQHGTLVFGSPALPRPARLVQRTVEGVARDVYHLHRLETVIGRESGDIVFTDDPYMSRRHAMIRRSSSSGSYTLVDLNSSNGTFVGTRGDWPLQDGDSMRVGQHLFRVELAPG